MNEIVVPSGELLSIAVSLFVWGSTLTFGAVILFWVVQVAAFGLRRERPDVEYGYDDIQARILTIDDAPVVQETVDSLPAGLVDRHVIAEAPIDIDGATVHVVPDTFECDAVRKGRAIEWARRALACEKEFALYLDEDSLVTDFGGLPDADIVQIQERPRRTDSFLTYLADIYRMGLHFEQRAFERLSVPLYAWGGGLAVRTTVEEEVTWNRASLVEDTAFVWRAVLRADADFRVSEAVFTNQAPPSFREILEQRRRWIAGNHQEAVVLPRTYRWVTRVRNVVGGISPFAPLTLIPTTLLGLHLFYVELLAPIAVLLASFTFGWFLVGLHLYDVPRTTAVVGFALAPVASLVHSMGVVAGLVSPPDDFRVTRKVPREEWKGGDAEEFEPSP